VPDTPLTSDGGLACPTCGGPDVTVEQYEVHNPITDVTINALLTCLSPGCPSRGVPMRFAEWWWE
jgi:hypothetical protein